MPDYHSNSHSRAPEKKCLTCRYYDPRTCFCRKNPPQVVLNTDGYFSAVFPKMSLPHLDFCHQHEPLAKRPINPIPSEQKIDELSLI